VTPEGKVKKAVSAVIAKYEPRVYSNMPVPNGYGESMLDYVGGVKVRENLSAFFMVETKRPGKDRTPRQSQCASRVERAGGRVFTVNSVDDPRLAEFEAWIQACLAGSPP
jgi:hypothetical protein